MRGGDNWMPVPPHLREKVGDAVGSVLAEARALWLELPEHQEKAEALAKRAEEQAAARARFAVWQPGDAPLEKRKSRPPHAGYVPDLYPYTSGASERGGWFFFLSVFFFCCLCPLPPGKHTHTIPAPQTNPCHPPRPLYDTTPTLT